MIVVTAQAVITHRASTTAPTTATATIATMIDVTGDTIENGIGVTVEIGVMDIAIDRRGFIPSTV